ncbi:MAG: sigma-54-dependent Fis family transcriptional regulator [Acidobacteria bacterium ACB2]|nr:sigma-54-dependent Fis family transcriptional regulator [Acidobacteria bacterium ACB2]
MAPAGRGRGRGAGVKVLVVEDEPGSRNELVELVRDLGYSASAAGSVAEADAALARLLPDVCVTDLGLPDGDGLDVVRAAKAAGRDCAVVVLTGRGSVKSAIEAMKAGAHDFLLKPLKTAQLASALAQLSEQHEAARGLLPAVLPDPDAAGGLAGMVGRSAPMLEVFRLLTRVARSNAPVMITGESGSGKEVAAATVHLLSRRAKRPFVAVNCGAISPTLVESELFGHEKGAFTGADRRRAGTFEMAHGGTLFLDEVTEMPPELQVKLLRVLETRTFRRVGGTEELDMDVRLVASSNRDLADAVRREAFRADLFYRLNVFPLRLPPLRERREDVPLLAERFLSEIEEKERRGFSSFEPPALEALCRHDWPGNVRELKNAVHRAYVLSDPPAIQAEAAEAVLTDSGATDVRPTAGDEESWPAVPVRVGETLQAVERKVLTATLQAVKGDKRAAAELLGVSLKTIYNKLREYQLEP